MDTVLSPEHLALDPPDWQKSEYPRLRWIAPLSLKPELPSFQFNARKPNFLNQSWIKENALIKLWKTHIPRPQDWFSPDIIKNPSPTAAKPRSSVTEVVTPGPVLTGIGIAVRF